jgi:outer membrane protein OmpA-like peptidoglycan-associated protein
MAIDLIGLVKSAISSSGAIDKISGNLGETPAATQTALQASVPALLAAMIGKLSSESGIASLLSLFNSGSYDGSLLSNLGKSLSGSGATSVIDSGKAIAKSLLGDKLSPVANAVASQAGVSATSATSVLALAGPLLMNAIGKATAPGGPSASSLTSLLSSQKDALAAALPSSLGSLVGMSSLSGVRAAIPPIVPEVEQPGRDWLWPILLAVLVIGGLIYYFTRGTTEPVKEAATSVVSTANDAAKSALTALGEFFSRKLPNGVELNIPRLGIENKLIDFIEDASKPVDKTTWFDFDRLLFDTGKATLQPSSQEQLGNIANILKAYPKVKVKIGGYTDNTGNSAANLALSSERANNVMAELVKLGVPADRMTAEGYGDQFPVGDNATEEGRAKNRRISLRVTEK